MDSSAWIGFTILAVVILLLGYVRKASMAHSKKLNNLFKKIVRGNNLHVTEVVSWDGGLAGIDKEKKALILVQEQDNELKHSIIDLHELNSCKLVHDRSPSVTRILIVLEFSENTMLLTICFYNSSTDITVNMAELKEKAEKLKDGINELMPKKQKG